MDAILFYRTKKGGEEVKKKRGWVVANISRVDVLIFSFLQPFTGDPGQNVSCELKQRCFSLNTQAWEAGFSERGN